MTTHLTNSKRPLKAPKKDAPPLNSLPPVSIQQSLLDEKQIEAIFALNAKHEKHFSAKLKIETALNRTMVSFQANKHRAVYRWCKYKEGFSAGLVEYFLDRYSVHKGKLLDPFAGSGTALFAASYRGLGADGIELLPIGQRVIETKQLIDSAISPKDISTLSSLSAKRAWRSFSPSTPLNTLRITNGAYPPDTAKSISSFLTFASKQPPNIASVLTFALLCILESISYTRKDGQYLRWDYRSGRRQGKKIFDKGAILEFDAAISAKLNDIVSDLRNRDVSEDLFSAPNKSAPISLFPGSCLDILPTIAANNYSCIITSPPYCNRYDYTRTYALELAMLGVSEDALIKLRQDMVSCTVENRAKDLLLFNSKWRRAISAADNNDLLQAILSYLESEKEKGHLNNTGIPRMVRGYFYEMACVIQECARILKRGAPLIMVNDNVRYAGVSVSVDIILSEIAQALGFTIENILILPNGKGNSSQQMGIYGRDPLRKCVYVWRKGTLK